MTTQQGQGRTCDRRTPGLMATWKNDLAWPDVGNTTMPTDPPRRSLQDRGLTLGKIKSLAHARCIKADISALSSAGILESRSFAQLHDRSTHHALRIFSSLL